MTGRTLKESNDNNNDYFSATELEEMYQTLERLSERFFRLVTSYVEFPYASERAREYARHGFARRMYTIQRCIENVFSTLPPEQKEIPNDLTDIEINLQSFMANVFGAIDNLAWVWALESADRKGRPVPDKFKIGLRQKHRDLRATLSNGFADLLNDRDDWFDYLEDYRDALAHRVPLYVVPYTVSDENISEHNRISYLMTQAVARNDPDIYNDLVRQRTTLATFQPVMVHSFKEAKGIVRFHKQILIDFVTLEEIGLKMMEELNALNS